MLDSFYLSFGRVIFNNRLYLVFSLIWSIGKLALRLLTLEATDPVPEGTYARFLLSISTIAIHILIHLRSQTVHTLHPPSSVSQTFRPLLKLARSQLPVATLATIILAIRMPFSLSMTHWVTKSTGAISKNDPAGLAHAIKFLLICGSIDSVLDFGCVFLFSLLKSRTIQLLRSTLLGALLNRPMSFFDTQQSGALMSRLTADTLEIADLLSWVFRWAMEACFRVIGVSIYLLLLSWRLALLLSCVIPINSFIANKYGKWSAENAIRTQDALAAANAKAQEILSNVQTIKSYSAEAKERGRYNQLLDLLFTYQMREAAASGGYYMFVNTFMMNSVGQFILLGYSGYLVFHGELDVDGLIAALFFRSMLQEWFDALLNSYTAIVKCGGAGKRVIELLDRGDQANLSDLEKVEFGIACHRAPTVRFLNVSMRYENRPEVQVLDRVSFTAMPGKTTCLVGPSGSGKSTILSILQGLYTANHGRITIDGVPIEAAKTDLMATVAQEPVLFKGTIQENVLYGCDVEDEGNLQRSLEIACADEFVCKLPGGVSCVIGERGVQLSGGQKQRLAIARAVACQPRLLLLDEATSALDPESEDSVQKALERAMRGRTTIMVSHRLSSVLKIADWVVVMHNGRVIEEGTPSDLSSREELEGRLSFRSLLKHQVGI